MIQYECWKQKKPIIIHFAMYKIRDHEHYYAK